MSAVSTDTYSGLTLEEWKTLGLIVIPLIVLLVTNLVTLGKIRKETKESIRKELIIILIKNKREKLEKFYDPIITFLSINEGIFQSFGPKSFPENVIKKEVAAKLWENMRQNIIVENNQKIADVIKSYSHLISSTDNVNNYLDFVRHASSYEHFIQYPNERHNEFPYPKDILSNTLNKRAELLNEINSVEQNLSTILEQLKK